MAPPLMPPTACRRGAAPPGSNLLGPCFFGCHVTGFNQDPHKSLEVPSFARVCSSGRRRGSQCAGKLALSGRQRRRSHHGRWPLCSHLPSRCCILLNPVTPTDCAWHAVTKSPAANKLGSCSALQQATRLLHLLLWTLHKQGAAAADGRRLAVLR